MSESNAFAAAFTAELQRLILENAQLKAALVAMDTEREIHPMPYDGFLLKKVEPTVVHHHVSPSEMLGLTSKGDLVKALWERGAKQIAGDLMKERVMKWGSFVPDPAGGLTFKMTLFFLGEKR